MTGPVRVAYDALIAANELKPDPAQERAVTALDRLAATLTSGGFFDRLFGQRSDGPAGMRSCRALSGKTTSLAIASAAR